MNSVQATVKCAIDIVVSFVALAVLSPLLLLIALAIRLTSPGPALFCQQRLGHNGDASGSNVITRPSPPPNSLRSCCWQRLCLGEINMEHKGNHHER
jgi:hypothetical protein